MRAWAEINLDNIAHNISEIRKKIGADTKLLAVIKADGYGHGYKEVARVAVDNGADFFGVASADEAMQLRKNGFETPILILGPVIESEYKDVIENNIAIPVFDRQTAKNISSVAEKIGKKAIIHIKIDTGMSRIGYVADGLEGTADRIAEEVVYLTSLPNIVAEGIFTHFAKADEPESDFTDIQYERFVSVCEAVKSRGVDIALRHCCNSCGIMNYPQYHLDMVRSGIITYGYYPYDGADKEGLSILPAMQLKATVTDVKRIGGGVGVGYGGTYVTEHPIDIATFSIGYADGYFRSLSSKGEVIVGGNIANVIGRVCMDQTMADVSGIKNIKIGDEVILFGTDGNNTITVDSVAAKAGTINYEVLSVVGKRVPRVYIKDGKVVKVLNYLV